jgi:branched-chain amino acid transport system permease protein
MGYEITLLTTMGIAVIFALGLNIVAGFCGQISLGHAAFYGIGAYTAAMMTKAGVPFLIVLAPAMLLAGTVGVVVGFASLRVRHDFLAITTMGVGFLFIGIVQQMDWVGGEMGLSGIPAPGMGRPAFMLFVLALVAVTAVLSFLLRRSWMGFAFDAIADDEDTAEILGIDVSRYKLAAFAIGTAISGLAGALYAHHVRFIDPNSFGFVESVTVLAMVVVGGIGSIGGVALAAAAMSIAPLLFQVIEDYKLLAYGALLFLMMRVCPDGIAGLAARLRRGRAA